MASLQRVKVGGRTYWRIVESRRVNGKPRAIPVLHLGTADALLQRLRDLPQGPLSLRSFQHGDVAALKAIADRLAVVSIIDRHVPTSAHPLSVGHTLLLAALNRAVHPRSKRGWIPWAQGTSLQKLFPELEVETLTSQFFWDQMQCVSLEALEKIEADLTRTVVETLKIELDTLLYDTTNFFTYIASTNRKPQLPQRGHSKQKRSDLRLFSLALLVSREGQIPLCSYLYDGRTVDSKSFPTALTRIRQRLKALALDLEDITLVYDKGNNSKANQALIDASEVGYVAALVPSHYPELLRIPLTDYRRVTEGPLKDTPVLRLQRRVWGQERTLVLFVSERLRQGQIRGLEQTLQKRLRALETWKEQLAKPRSQPRKATTLQKKIDRLTAGQYIRQILHVHFDATAPGSERLQFSVDLEARTRLEREVFGKRLLMSNRREWSEEEIIDAYHGQSHVEGAFRQCKDEDHLAVRPQYHWTDQKIHVYTFICVLAFLLSKVLEYEARTLDRTEGLSGLLDLLGKVRLAMILHVPGTKGGRPRCHWQLEETQSEALEFFKRLVPHKPPFVYTPKEN